MRDGQQGQLSRERRPSSSPALTDTQPWEEGESDPRSSGQVTGPRPRDSKKGPAMVEAFWEAREGTKDWRLEKVPVSKEVQRRLLENTW